MTPRVQVIRGSPGELHALAVASPAEPELWLLQADRRAVVLGSRQSFGLVDAEACRSAGVDVVRRRSGGGAVLVEPGAITWVDVILPAGAEHWTDDVVASMRWCGELWRTALVASGAGSPATFAVCQRPGASSALSDLVCFAGLGAGEVTSSGAKLVGISQRRTRHAARFQCMVHHSWQPRRLLALLAEPRPTVEAIDALPVAEIDAEDTPALLDALARAFAG